MPAEGRGRIVFADDDTRVLRATGSALSLSGFEVTEVESGPQALAVLDTQLPDVLLADIDMLGNRNLELVQVVVSKRPLVPVVILTGYPALETAVRALRLGAIDYIIKPHAIESLLERLDLAVRQARVLRSVGQTESLAGELSQRIHALMRVIVPEAGTHLAPAPEDNDVSSSLDPLRNLARGELDRLSVRERAVVRELARGHPPQRIAETLGISTNTVRNHLKLIFFKLGVNSQVSLLGKLAATRP